MKTNFKHIMEICGMVGFSRGLLMEKPQQKPNENVESLH